MGKIFDLESPFMRALNWIADMMIMNLLVMVCCIPVVTVGAAQTGMHYVFLKMVRGEDGYLVRGFFKSFTKNFKQATILWLIMLLIAAVYIGDIVIFKYSGIEFSRVLVIAVIAVAFVVLMIAAYVFPLLSRFDNSIKNTIKNAALLALANLPKTVLMLICYALPIVLAYFSPYAVIFIMLFGVSLPAYAAARLYSGIFKKFEPEEELTSDMDFSLVVDEENGESDGESE